VRFGAAASGLFALDHRDVDGRSHRRPWQLHAARGPPFVNMMLREVAGRSYEALRDLDLRLLSGFHRRLDGGEDLPGKKIQATEMKLVTLYILIVPTLILVFSGSPCCSTRAKSVDPEPRAARPLRVGTPSPRPRTTTARPSAADREHGLVQHDIGSRCSAGRFLPIVLVLAIAGWPAASNPCLRLRARFRPERPLCGAARRVILIVVALTYFPVLALGPILEHLSL
jgi:K+-transporting ATPase ATPase A chain